MKAYDTLVLNPEWISNGVYKIINWADNRKKPTLPISDFRNIFEADEKRFPKDKDEFLFELMKHYELAFETERGQELVIPHLLPKDKPNAAQLPNFPIDESLMLQFKADEPLPPNTISRFIVRHNREIKKNGKPLVWRKGVVLTDGKDSLAQVEEKDRKISVFVKGKTKTEYISELRETLIEIFDSYKSENPELLYRIRWFGEFELMLSDEAIKGHIEEGRYYYDHRSKQEIPLEQAKDDYNIDVEKKGKKTIFISYSTKNTEQANTVKARLEAEDYATIIDHEFFMMGERFEDEINRAIRSSDATLLLISEESLSSPWVGMENVVGKVLQEITARPLLAAFLNDDFLDTRFVVNLIKKSIKPKLDELEGTITEQMELGIGIENLQEDLSRQKRLMANLPQIVAFMRERNCINISDTGDELNKQMNNLVAQLKRVLE